MPSINYIKLVAELVLFFDQNLKRFEIKRKDMK